MYVCALVDHTSVHLWTELDIGVCIGGPFDCLSVAV